MPHISSDLLFTEKLIPLNTTVPINQFVKLFQFKEFNPYPAFSSFFFGLYGEFH